MLTVRVAIPAMDELDYLPVTLNALARQKTRFPFEVYVCVNQPDSYWYDSTKVHICDHNKQLLDYLQNFDFLTLHVLDYSSPGKGWPVGKSGVGYARKILFSNILNVSEEKDIIVSLDADTYVGADYIQSIAENFTAHSSMNAIAVPYYHDVLPNNETQSKAMLRYEIYMRNYAINLLKIKSPYGFTALGSAIAMKAGALRKIGNITPLQSGEDFYLVQKFCKMGGLSLFNSELVRPANRYSNRVPFGTGPAMSLGAKGVWDSYPLYHHNCFESIFQAYSHLQELYDGTFSITDNDFLLFLQKDIKKRDIWTDIRQNVSDFSHFVKAFHQKADGLRILQYVRQKQKQKATSEEQSICDNVHLWLPEKYPIWLSPDRPLSSYSLTQLDSLRNILFEEEQLLRKHYY